MATDRLFVKVTREILPRVSSRYPFVYLEHGRLEVSDSSVQWCDSLGQIIPLPIATIATLLLGPGTSVTHDAVRTCASANCLVCWVGEDAMIFYAGGVVPTSNSRRFRLQAGLSSDPKKAVEVARRMFSRRFPDMDLSDKSLKEMMGMEGHRVRRIYQEMAEKHGVGWTGRSFSPGAFEMSDATNRILTASNACLYGVICSVVHALGYSPHLGFVHSGSPLPFIYDIADLYKEELSIDLAFRMTKEMSGIYDKHMMSSSLIKKMVETRFLERLSEDIGKVIGDKHADRDCE